MKKRKLQHKIKQNSIHHGLNEKGAGKNELIISPSRRFSGRVLYLLYKISVRFCSRLYPRKINAFIVYITDIMCVSVRNIIFRAFFVK